MRTPIIISLLALLIAVSVHFTFTELQNGVQQQTLKVLNNLGFYSPALPEPQKRIGAILYKDIALDEEGFSTIDALEIRYKLKDLLLHKSLDTLNIYGLSLTGEYSQKDGLNITGWKPLPLPLPPKSYRLKTLDIKDAQISLLTDNVGGLSFGYSLQVRLKDKNAELQAHIKSKQKHISFTANASGFLNEKGAAQIDVELEQGKLEIPPIKATRINGWINITRPINLPFKIISELRAGGLNIYGFPWQNASGTVEIQNSSYRIFADMKSTGYQGIELGLQFTGPSDIYGNIYTKKGANLVSFIEKQESPIISQYDFSPYHDLDNLNLDFVFNPETEKITIKKASHSPK